MYPCTLVDAYPLNQYACVRYKAMIGSNLAPPLSEYGHIRTSHVTCLLQNRYILTGLEYPFNVEPGRQSFPLQYTPYSPPSLFIFSLLLLFSFICFPFRSLQGQIYFLMSDSAPVKHELWQYKPNKVLGVIGAIAFLILSLIHIVKLFRNRVWFCIPFVIGGLVSYCSFCAAMLIADRGISLKLWDMLRARWLTMTPRRKCHILFSRSLF